MKAHTDLSKCATFDVHPTKFIDSFHTIAVVGIIHQVIILFFNGNFGQVFPCHFFFFWSVPLSLLISCLMVTHLYWFYICKRGGSRTNIVKKGTRNRFMWFQILLALSLFFWKPFPGYSKCNGYDSFFPRVKGRQGKAADGAFMCVANFVLLQRCGGLLLLSILLLSY